jgi:hypothetical protein
LRSVPALRFADVPAAVGRREFGADALPAGAGVESDLMAIDQVASQDGLRSQRNDPSCAPVASASTFLVDAMAIINRTATSAPAHKRTLRAAGLEDLVAQRASLAPLRAAPR